MPSTLIRASTPFLDRLAKKGVVGLLDIHSPEDRQPPSSEKGILSLCGALDLRDTVSRAELLTSGIEPEVSLKGPHWVWLLNPARIENGRLESYVESASPHALWERFLNQVDRAGAGSIFRYSPVRRADGAIVRMAAFYPVGSETPSSAPVPARGERLPDGGVLGDLITEASGFLPPDPEFNCVWPWGMGKWWPGSGNPVPVADAGRWMVAAVPLARSIGRYLHWTVPPVPGGTGDTDTSLENKRDVVLSALRHPETTHVFCHIEGFDLASHRRNPEEKRLFLERFDKEFVPALAQALDEDIVDNLWFTCDHLSSPVTGNHECGPVPFLHLSRDMELTGSGRFEESVAASGPRLSIARWKESIQL